jgi:DNA polymerase-4
MLWIGKASAQALERNGIHTIGDIANEQNKEILERTLDKNWYVHYQHANGFGNDELDYSQNLPKSIGSSETFLNDTSDFIEIKIKLEELTKDVIKRLKYHQQKAKTISVNIKTPDFKLHNKSFTLNQYTDHYNDVILTVIRLFEENFSQISIRLVGVSLANLVENKSLNISSELFDDFQKQTPEILSVDQNTIITEINKKFAKNIIGIAKEKLDY